MVGWNVQLEIRQRVNLQGGRVDGAMDPHFLDALSRVPL